MARDFTDWPRWLAVATVLLTAASGPWVIAVASPLETSTLATCLTLANYLTLRHLGQQIPTRGQAWGLAAVWLTLALWRIDAPLLVGGLGLFFIARRGLAWQRRDLLVFSTVASAYGPYTLFRLNYFGDLLTNT